MKFLNPKLLLAILTLVATRTTKAKSEFKFASDEYRSHTGLSHEHDETLRKLDWYFEDLKSLAS